MFLKKAFINTNLNIKKEIISKAYYLNKLFLKPFADFIKMDIPPGQQRFSISKLVLNFEMEKQILSSLCNVNAQVHEKRAHLSELYENNKDFKDKFVFNIIYLHEANLEQLLNYFLYNHEHFSNDELDYFLYLFCSKSELTNKISIKMKDLDKHKTISLIWDYFLKNYKKIDNIDDCNKFLFMFSVYNRKYSFNRDDFIGKFFNKNNIRFFLNTILKYMKVSLNKVSIGKLLNILTILGEFKHINYYDFLKNREDEVDKLPYWTLRRLLVRINTDKRNEKSIRQIINLLINPLIKDFTSIDISEKCYLLRHFCVLDQRIILITSTKKLKHQLYEDIMTFLEQLPEDFELNVYNMKILVNLFQSAKNYEKLCEDGRILKCLQKFLNAFETYKQKEKLKSKLEVKNTIINNYAFESQNNQISNQEANSKKTNNKSELNNMDFNQDILNEMKNLNIFDRENYNIKNFDEKIKQNLNNKEDLLFEDIDELNNLDLELRVIKKKEDEELEFLDSEALIDKIPSEAKKSEFDIFNKNSVLEKFLLNEQENSKSDINEENNINSNQKSDDKQFEIFSPELGKIKSSISANIIYENQNLKSDERNKNSLSHNMNNILGYYFLLTFHQVINFKHPSFKENKELAVTISKTIQQILFEMDIEIVKEKIKVNLIFDSFVIMEHHGLTNKEFFTFLADNFSENMVDIIIIDSFTCFINWTDKYLNDEEKKVFYNKITKILLLRLTKDYTIYNYFRVASLVCSLNRKRTNLTDNLHFELISFIDLESRLVILIKLFSDYQKCFYKEVHKDYSRNLVNFLLGKIKIKELNLITNRSLLIDFYFSMLALELENFDPDLDKKILEQHKNILKYIENTSFFEVELSNVVKFFYNTLDQYKEHNSDRALGLFFDMLEHILTNKSILILAEIDRYMIYFALNSIQKKRNKSLIKQAIKICDSIYEKTKTHLDFNMTESSTALEKLLENNIICKSVVKNFLVNIQIFKRLKESENFKLDDQTSFDINLINFKYQNVERNKDIINQLLEEMKDKNIISQDLFNISVFN